MFYIRFILAPNAIEKVQLVFLLQRRPIYKGWDHLKKDYFDNLDDKFSNKY
jgi:hypothetical protein